MKEVGAHLRALMHQYRIKSEWSHYLPLVQRIINYTVDGSNGADPGRVIFGDMVDSDLAMDFLEGQTGRKPEDYLIKLREVSIHIDSDYSKIISENIKLRERWMVDLKTRK
jgi:hypothetical protein